MRQICGELDRILVPVPLKGDYKAPLRQACYFHSKYGSQITILNVVREATLMERLFMPRRRVQKPEKALKKLKRMVQDCLKDGSLPENVELEVVTGEIIPAILKVARRKSSDLIIIKKARRIRTRQNLFKQENANRLIGNSVCPVLTIQEKPALEGIDRILLPVDITKKTEHTVGWAKSIARRFGAEIHVVSVMNRDIHHLRSFSYQKGRKIVNEMRKEGIKVELVLLKQADGPMGDVVLEYARKFRPNLLLIMTHQEKIIFDNKVGSFAREIIHRADMPVFCVIPYRQDPAPGITRPVTGKRA